MIKYGKEWQIPIFSEAEGKRRWRKIRERMAAREIDCLIVSGTTAIQKASYADLRYVTNHINWSDDEYCVFPFKSEPTFVVYGVQHKYWADKVSWVTDIISTSKNDFSRTPAADVVRKIKELGLERGTIGISNKRTMLAYAYEYICKELPHAQILEAGEILRDCRRIKSAEELEFVRKSGECADKGFKAMAEIAAPGITDYDLAAACEAAISKSGAEVGSFTLFNTKQWPNGWGFPHGGSNRKLKKGDLVLNEITPCFGGYFTQLCRPISLGQPTDDFMKMYEIHMKIYEVARKGYRAGNYTSDADKKAGEAAMKTGLFSRVDSGFQHLDSLNADPNFDLELKPNMVYQIHPWTNPTDKEIKARKGHMGHIIGDANICTESEPECVHKTPRKLTIV